MQIVHKTQVFECACCGKTSIGPFMIGGVQVAPACRNDDCASQWWNRPLLGQVKSITKAYDPMVLQALAKRPGAA